MNASDELAVLRLAHAFRTEEVLALLRKPLDMDGARVEFERRRSMPTLFESRDAS